MADAKNDTSKTDDKKASDDEVKSTVAVPAQGTTSSKTKALIEAARAKNVAAQKEADATKTNPEAVRLTSEEETKQKEAAEANVKLNVQSAANSLTGSLDPEAMGDVKGDGGDAKNYADSDPDKALGVPTWRHGTAQTRDGQPVATVFGDNISERTRAEMDRGKKALGNRKSASPVGRTTVEDA